MRDARSRLTAASPLQHHSIFSTVLLYVMRAMPDGLILHARNPPSSIKTQALGPLHSIRVSVLDAVHLFYQPSSQLTLSSFLLLEKNRINPSTRKMRTSILRTTLRQIARRTSHRTINNAKTANRSLNVEWKRTLCVALARPLDLLADDAEENIPVTFECWDDDDGT